MYLRVARAFVNTAAQFFIISTSVGSKENVFRLTSHAKPVHVFREDFSPNVDDGGRGIEYSSAGVRASKKSSVDVEASEPSNRISRINNFWGLKWLAGG